MKPPIFPIFYLVKPMCYKIENEIIVVFQTKIQDKASSNISLLYICKILFIYFATQKKKYSK